MWTAASTSPSRLPPSAAPSSSASRRRLPMPAARSSSAARRTRSPRALAIPSFLRRRRSPRRRLKAAPPNPLSCPLVRQRLPRTAPSTSGSSTPSPRAPLPPRRGGRNVELIVRVLPRPLAARIASDERPIGGRMIRILTAFAARVTCGAIIFASCSALATEPAAPEIPEIPLPPAITGLIGLPQPFSSGRRAHLLAVRQEAEQRGLPADVADAVVQVESAYNPYAVGGVGEVGLMQVRPETAAMLGHRGGTTELFDPVVNIRYGVTYLARAWQLAERNLCRALMKYRAGHGEERMTPLSVEYCRRARGHLAAIGSPLGAGALPITPAPGETFAATAARQRAASAGASNAGAVPV